MARGTFHHIDINVSDLAASRRVYALVLGFLGYHMVKDKESGCEWDLPPSTPNGSDGASFGIKPRRAEEEGVSHRRYAPGLHHFAWRAESRADVDTLHALLMGEGVTILDPPASYPEYSGDYYAVFFEDPDGIKLELVYAPGWV